MSEQTSQEPTMEEILASIRRIISEDDTPAAAGEDPVVVAAAAEPDEAVEPPALPVEVEAEVVPVTAAEPPPIEDDVDDDALELTEKVEPMGDLDFLDADDDPPAPPAAFAPAPIAVAAPSTQLVSEHVANAAASAFGQLSAAVAMPHSERTLEDVVRELLRPQLQQWLDQNLPDIVRQAVDAEVERIARSRVR